MFNKESVITLENNKEYAVVDKYLENGINYVYLIDLDDHNNIIFGKVFNDEIERITDPEELEKVIKQVNINLHEVN